MAIDVRPSRKTDVRAVSRTLGRAFYEDPVMRWMLPDDAQRATGLPRTFAAITRRHFLAGGGVEVATNGSGVGAATLWDPPGRWKQSRLEGLLMMPSYLLATGGRTARGRQVGELMKKHVDAEHAPAYLESSNPDNIPYYMRFGFEVTGEIKLPDGGPSMIPMWRPAR